MRYITWDNHVALGRHGRYTLTRSSLKRLEYLFNMYQRDEVIRVTVGYNGYANYSYPSRYMKRGEE